MVDVAALPVLTGHKTARERFAGATRTWTCEGMMGDGKALQMGTSHELGQNFAKAFGITFSNAEGALEHVWQTSWGASTRLIGALVMGHGDDFGLRLPPALAPAQVVVLMIKEERGRAARRRRPWWPSCGPHGHRVRLDDRTETSFGRRSVDWELKGVPVRVEIGPRDLAEGNVTVVTRHRREKETVALAGVGETVAGHPGPGRSRAAGRGHGGPRRPARSTSARWRRPSRPAAPASPGSAWAPWGPTARTGWPTRRCRSAACSGPTAAWPSPATPRPI